MKAKYSFRGHYAQALMGSAMSYGRWKQLEVMVMESSVLS
jgi:hypothetical protein